jgi:tetratricopeptide (TPR) repeat protein
MLTPINIIAALSLILLCAMLFLNLKKQKADQLSQEKADARFQEILTSISKSQSEIENGIKEMASQSQNLYRSLCDMIAENFKTIQSNHQELKELIRRNFAESSEKANALNLRLETLLKEFATQTTAIIEKNSEQEARDAADKLRVSTTLNGKAFYNLACFYLDLKEKAAAMECLRKAIAAGFQNPELFLEWKESELFKDDTEFDEMIGGLS